MVRRVLMVASAILMIIGLMVLTWGFRDLPIDQRPEWMVVQMVLWPVAAFGMAEGWRLVRLARQGLRVHFDRLRLVCHGIPALIIVTLPSGAFTTWMGSGSMWSLLDFPTAKVMAAFWLAATLWASWEVRP
ncbi:hypothetical protein [Sulfobacillus harzensis]|uniref:hypothetical protein n=1 Tax=Sulfobacillus harzensis TaxID=2729629 RepID=UPI0030843659